jgi:transcriptional antiterminator NusG
MAHLDTYNAEFGRVLARSAPLNEAFSEQKWYAAYTSANHERSVASQLGVRGIEHFLPTYSSVRRWKDRRVTLRLPLFPGYVFVRMALRDRLPVVQVPGVARLVGFNGVPTPLRWEEIEGLKKGLVSGMRAEPYPFLTTGRRVRVRSGPLAGTEGVLVRRKKLDRFVISLELIQRSIAVDLAATDIEAVPN